LLLDSPALSLFLDLWPSYFQNHMNDMLKQILNEAFQHVILESCLRYRYQKEAVDSSKA
jgi:hypothetical protein